MITEDSFFYLPNLYTFQNGNSFFGSYRGLRFYVQGVDNEKEGEKLLDSECGRAFFCRVWLGEYCMEESEILDSAYYPMDQAGYEQVVSWLDSEYEKFLGKGAQNDKGA